MKSFCRYCVVDLSTCYCLACGERGKDFERHPDCYSNGESWRKGFRKIGVKFRYVQIKDKPCVIMYWIGVRKRKPWNVVTAVGAYVGMCGKRYDFAFKFSHKAYKDLVRGLGL